MNKRESISVISIMPLFKQVVEAMEVTVEEGEVGPIMENELDWMEENVTWA